MDQEEEEAENTATASSNRKPLPKNMSVSKVITTNSNKESPVWIIQSPPHQMPLSSTWSIPVV